MKTPEKEKEKDKEGEGASSYATTKDGKEGDYNCFCFGSNKCRLHRCPKKKGLPPDNWYNPE